jgi:hypothetical protein
LLDPGQHRGYGGFLRHCGVVQFRDHHHDEIGVGEEIEFIKWLLGFVYFREQFEEVVDLIGDLHVDEVEDFSEEFVDGGFCFFC